jgi:hypothetical protein
VDRNSKTNPACDEPDLRLPVGTPLRNKKSKSETNHKRNSSPATRGTFVTSSPFFLPLVTMQALYQYASMWGFLVDIDLPKPLADIPTHGF